MQRGLGAIIAAYLTVYIVWGSTYLAISWSVESLPPYYLVSLRFLASGAVFLLACLASGRLRRPPSRKELLSALFMGLFLLVLGNGLVSVGETEVDSYLASLVIASTPLIVALFNRIFFGERLSWLRLVSLFLGLAGVAVLLYDGEAVRFSPGMGFIVAGFLSWGLATSLGHRLPVHPDTLVNSGLQMGLAGLMALVPALALHGSPADVIPRVSSKSWLALAYLTTVGGAAFYAYSYLLKREPSRRIVSYAIVNPLIAVLIGMALGGEKPVALLVPGIAAILLALVLTLYGDALLVRFKEARRRHVKS
jgi:drug/metabolite transporter (DMT)-like permease